MPDPSRTIGAIVPTRLALLQLHPEPRLLRMMKNSLKLLLTGSALAFLLTLASCGKEEETPEVSIEPAESSIGNIINAAQKTADEANARTSEIEEASQ